jgi:hypothetical protein
MKRRSLRHACREAIGVGVEQGGAVTTVPLEQRMAGCSASQRLAAEVALGPMVGSVGLVLGTRLARQPARWLVSRLPCDIRETRL